jgi:hypothetical protein
MQETLQIFSPEYWMQEIASKEIPPALPLYSILSKTSLEALCKQLTRTG